MLESFDWGSAEPLMKPFKDIYKEKNIKKLDELVDELANDRKAIRSGIADRKASIISR